MVEEIIDYTQEKNRSGLLFYNDFEKAFDPLEWVFIFLKCSIIEIFWEQVIRWIRMQQTNKTSNSKNYQGFCKKT